MALSRRDLLCQTAAGCASFAAAGLMSNCGFDVSAAEETDATADVSGQISVSVAQGALAMTGGAIILRVSAPAGVTVPDGGVLVVRHSSTEFAAVAALCTHKQCPMGYSKTERQIA